MITRSLTGDGGVGDDDKGVINSCHGVCGDADDGDDGSCDISSNVSDTDSSSSVVMDSPFLTDHFFPQTERMSGDKTVCWQIKKKSCRGVQQSGRATLPTN